MRNNTAPLYGRRRSWGWRWCRCHTPRSVMRSLKHKDRRLARQQIQEELADWRR